VDQSEQQINAKMGDLETTMDTKVSEQLDLVKNESKEELAKLEDLLQQNN